MTLLTLCRMGDETSSRATCQCELSSHLILSEWRSLVCAVVHTAHFSVREGHVRDHPGGTSVPMLTELIAQQLDDVRTVVENRQAKAANTRVLRSHMQLLSC